MDNGWDAFGQVAAVDFDGAGNLHILDSQAARITVVDLERAAQPIRRRAESESMEFHHEIPVVLDLRTSREATIWVLRRGDKPDSDGPIDLIAADGRYLGTFTRDATGLPSAFGPDGLVAFVERDDLDVQTVVVRRLPPGVR